MIILREHCGIRITDVIKEVGTAKDIFVLASETKVHVPGNGFVYSLKMIPRLDPALRQRFDREGN